MKKRPIGRGAWVASKKAQASPGLGCEEVPLTPKVLGTHEVPCEPG